MDFASAIRQEVEERRVVSAAALFAVIEEEAATSEIDEFSELGRLQKSLRTPPGAQGLAKRRDETQGEESKFRTA